MACLDISLPRWIKNLLQNPQGSNKDRTSIPEFFPGRNNSLERPSPALHQDAVEPRNPNRETSTIKYQSPQLISTPHSDPQSRPSDDIIVLPSGSSDDILLSPATSFHRTKPLEPLREPQQYVVCLLNAEK